MKELICLPFFSVLILYGSLFSQISSIDTIPYTPITVGDSITSIMLADEQNSPVDLKKLVFNKKSIIIFYRGTWNLQCIMHLRDINSIKSGLEKLGYQIVVIFPDTPDRVQKTKGIFNFDYIFLSDSTLDASKLFGINYIVPRQEMIHYRISNISIGIENSKVVDQLTYPSVFIVSPGGIVSFKYSNTSNFSYADDSYTRRIPIETLLEETTKASNLVFLPQK